MGNYLKYNNPHKLSLYIASGMPVITWRQAAIAEFVEKNDIGFVVDSILQIPGIIDTIDEKTYLTYRNNIQKLQEKVIDGEFTKSVLHQLSL